MGNESNLKGEIIFPDNIVKELEGKRIPQSIELVLSVTSEILLQGIEDWIKNTDDDLKDLEKIKKISNIGFDEKSLFFKIDRNLNIYKEAFEKIEINFKKYELTSDENKYLGKILNDFKFNIEKIEIGINDISKIFTLKGSIN